MIVCGSSTARVKRRPCPARRAARYATPTERPRLREEVDNCGTSTYTCGLRFVLGWALHELHGWTSVTVAAGDCIPGR